MAAMNRKLCHAPRPLARTMLAVGRGVGMTRVATCRNTVVSVFSALLYVALAQSAAAQGFGVRGGISIDPDQLFVGGHYETGAIVDHVHFKPNIEIGFGDDITLIALNFEGVYKFPDQGNWAAYAGGGPALNIASFEGDSDSGAGANFFVGIETDRGLAFEVKFGVADSPTVKFTVGYTFR
jgi:hypothetical protein